MNKWIISAGLNKAQLRAKRFQNELLPWNVINNVSPNLEESVLSNVR